VNAGADPNLEYLADGVTEGIISGLSRVPQLHVMARSTVFSSKGREANACSVCQFKRDPLLGVCAHGRSGPAQHGYRLQACRRY
jgi:hypothetical protein